MDPVAPKRPRVGRRFRKWSIAAAVILLLVSAHTAWDYVEARRLLAALGRRVEEPTRSTPGAVPHPSRDAAPFYLAAAALAQRAGTDRVRGELESLLRDSRDADRIPAETLVRLREFLDDNADALHLVDRATSLDFTRFRPGRDVDLHELIRLRWLCGLRSAYAALNSDGETAAASLVAEVRLQGGHDRPMSSEWPYLMAWRTSTIRHVQEALARTRPSESGLARIAVATQGADEDDEWTRFFVRERDRSVEWGRTPWAYGSASGEFGLLSAGGPSWFKLWRPLAAREVRRQVAQYEALIAASRRPWPSRIDAAAEASLLPGTLLSRLYALVLESRSDWLESSRYARDLLQLSALDLAGIRAARISVAVERYRRAHQEVLPDTLNALVPVYLDALPIDPFSGEPMRYRKTAIDYVVYSVGVNRQDDEGEAAEMPPSREPEGLRETGDLGVRIRLRPR